MMIKLNRTNRKKRRVQSNSTIRNFLMVASVKEILLKHFRKPFNYAAHSKDFVSLHGRGLSVSNMQIMHQFYVAYPIYATVSHKLSWSIYVELLKISNPLERSLYEKQSMLDCWNVHRLIDPNKSIFDKDVILKLAKQKKHTQKQHRMSDDEE